MLEAFKDIVTYDKPEYKLLKMKLDSRLNGTGYDSIINVLHSIYKVPFQRFSHNSQGKNGVISIEQAKSITYEVLFDGDNVKATPYFYFGIPEEVSNYVKQRIQANLPTSTLTFEDDKMQQAIDEMFSDCYVYEYHYAKRDILSLKVKENSLLENILSFKNDMSKGEGLLLQIEMKPVGDYWKQSNSEAWDKIRKGVDVTGKRGIYNGLVSIVGDVTESLLQFGDELLEIKSEDNSCATSSKEISVSKFSTASRQKSNSNGFKVCIRLYVIGCEEIKAKSYGTALQTALMEVEEDGGNNLIMKQIKGTKPLERGRVIGKFDLMSSKEVASLVNLPNQKLQSRFGIPNVKTKQIQAPKQMKKGDIKVGNLTLHGETVPIYLPHDRDLTCLPLFLITKMGGGKTTFLLNLCNDAIKAKHGLVLFDYIKDCQTAKSLLKMHPECLVLKFEDLTKLCTFAFPEVAILPTDDVMGRKIKANTVSKEVKFLLNSMASDTQPMTRIMSEYLTSACKVVFVYEKQTLYNVYQVLTDEDVRESYITNCVRDGIFHEKSFEISKLRELDKKPEKADGVLDRFSIINEDTILQEMLFSPYENNVNFVDIMDNAKPVVIMMPQDIFTSHIHKDILCVYFMNRIRLAMSRRKDEENIAHIIMDEIHQAPNTIELVASTLAEPRKFSMQYVMSLHSLSQIKNKEIREKILSVGCNFMLLKGISPQGFEEFKPMLNDEFEYSDIVEMDYEYGSLNMFMIENAYKNFITELPPALSDGRGKKYIGK